VAPHLHELGDHVSQSAMKTFSALLALLLVVLLPAHADEMMRSVQQKLQSQGFYAGSIDGIYGSQTAAAIRRYQVAENLQVTGELNPQTLASLGMVPRGRTHAPEPGYVAIANIFKGGPYISAPTELQIAAIQQAQKTLKLLGYYGGPINGKPDARLVTALKAWQKSAGFRQTGRFDETTLKGLDIMPD
jgi:N-acetylmuramoyl-L-alanine amidase